MDGGTGRDGERAGLKANGASRPSKRRRRGGAARDGLGGAVRPAAEAGPQHRRVVAAHGAGSHACMHAWRAYRPKLSVASGLSDAWRACVRARMGARCRRVSADGGACVPAACLPAGMGAWPGCRRTRPAHRGPARTAARRRRRRRGGTGGGPCAGGSGASARPQPLQRRRRRRVALVPRDPKRRPAVVPSRAVTGCSSWRGSRRRRAGPAPRPRPRSPAPPRRTRA